VKPQDERAGAVFDALGDPTRRNLLGQLATRPSATASELATTVPVTRQAVVKHLQTLGHAGLVAPTRSGREVHYSLTPSGLEDALTWMLRVGAQWDSRLERLRRQLERNP
jgi:DNA-binding transcriptional ArsR family regulator